MAPATVLVTGANRGIGYGLVKKFLENKDIKKVIATARKPEEATELKSISDSRLFILPLEVSCDKSIEKLYPEVEKIVGDDGLSLLVNNAGIYIEYDINKPYNRADLTRQLDVNTISPIVITQAFLPLLRKAAARQPNDPLSTSRAAVINISSAAGSIAMNDPELRMKRLGIKPDEYKPKPIVVYSASKSALNAVTKCFANDLKADGILVACFCPGWVKTDLGGKEALLTLDESMKDLVPTIYHLKPEQTGGYFNTKGEVIPY